MYTNASCQSRLLAANKLRMSDFEVRHMRSETAAPRHYAHFLPGTRNRLKQSLIDNSHFRFVFLQPTGKLASFSNPVVVDDTAHNPSRPTIVALLGDSVTGDTYISIEMDAFFTGIFAFMADGKASQVGMRRTTGLVASMVDDDEDVLPYDVIPWTETAYPNGPVLVFCDKIHAVPPSYKLYDGHDVTDPLPAAADGESEWEPLKEIVEVMSFHKRNYAGNSVHHTPTSEYANSNFDSAEPKGAMYDDRQDVGNNLTTSVYTTVTILAPDSPLAVAARPEIEEKRFTMLQTEAAALAAAADAAAPGQQPAGLHGLGNGETISQLNTTLGGMKEFFKTTTEGSKTGQKKKAVERITLMYQCLLGKKEMGTNSAMVLTPLPLSGAFEEFLGTSDVPEAQRLLKQGVDDKKWSLRRDDTILGMMNSLNTEIFSVPFTKCMKGCYWHSQPLAVCLLTFNKKLSLFGLLPVNEYNPAFRAMQATDQRSLYATLFDTDEKVDKVHDVFVDGDTNHVNSIKETILNFCLMLAFMSPRYAESYIYINMMKYLSVLNSPGGDSFLRVTVSPSPHMKHSLIADCQQILISCWGPFLNNNRLIVDAAAGIPISSADTTDFADAAINATLASIRSATQGHTASYDQPTSCFNWYHRRREARRQRPAQPAPRNQNQRPADPRQREKRPFPEANSTPPARRQQPRQVTPQIDGDRQKIQKTFGFLHCKRFPVSHFAHRFPTYDNLIMCTKFATVGLVCPFSAGDCNFAHVRNVKDLPDADRDAMISWMKNTPNMDWAAGKGPTTGAKTI